MDLYEYQARDMFEAHGVPVLRGITATTPEEARAAAAELGTPGRGGQGAGEDRWPRQGRRRQDRQAARTRRPSGPTEILGLDIKGHVVKTVMIAEGADIAEEYYFSLLLDRANRQYLAMCSQRGRHGHRDRWPSSGPRRWPGSRSIRTSASTRPRPTRSSRRPGSPATTPAEIARVLQLLGKVYEAEDATLVEVNPLVKTGDGTIIALDGKVSLDENADFRHPEHEALEDKSAEDPLEAAAKAKGLNYVKLDGSVGIIGNGAGLVMSTLDVVAYAGEEFAGSPKPANFLDIGGGASAEVMANGLEIIISDAQVKSVFVNVFGGITACDAVANGIVQAFELLASRDEHVDVPLVVRLDGNNAELGRQILTEADLPGLEQVDTMDGAARRAAELAAG